MRKIIGGVLVLILFFPFYNVFALDSNLPDAETIWEIVPEPVKNFIESAKEIGGGGFGKGVAGIDWNTPSGLYDRADGWFSETTGIGLLDAVKGIGNAIVWFLELFLSFLKWLLSLAGQ